MDFPGLNPISLNHSFLERTANENLRIGRENMRNLADQLAYERRQALSQPIPFYPTPLEMMQRAPLLLPRPEPPKYDSEAVAAFQKWMRETFPDGLFIQPPKYPAEEE